MKPFPSPLAYEHNGARVSRERFYAIACDPRRSVAVEACAGAGKTWMLVSRILRSLLAGAQPHEILAITFTKKAAGEMRQRLQQWLSECAGATPEALSRELMARGVANPTADEVQALRRLHAALLNSGRPVQIRTFHGWFAALLRNAPLAVLEQLGLPARYELLEDDSEAIELVWRRFHAQVAGQPAARADFEASVAAHGRFQTQKALLAALAKRVEFELADAHGVVDASIKPFGEQFPEFAALREPGDLLQATSLQRQQLAEAARALGRAGAPSFSAKGVELESALTARDLPAVLGSLLTQKGDPRKFSEKIEGLAKVRSAQDLALRLAAAAAQHEAWLHHQRMARLARLLIGQFGALKRERGWVDMNDVERAAFVMLSDPVLSGWVQERLDARLKHLLVDEFQDTNPLQWQALHAWLSGYAGAGGSAPSVFIVGDPKQSIYRFRRAEPQVFRAAQAFVADGLQGELLSCDHSHRNAPAVMAVVNQVMAMAQDGGLYQGFRAHTTESLEEGGVASLPQIPRETPARAAAAGDAPLVWRDSLTIARDLPEEKLIALECRQAAAWIARQIEGGLAPGQIMVLARKRDRLGVMEDELRALGIPAQQPEKCDLCDAPEVQDVVALLDALVSPAHDLSLARALKSPLFALGDPVLVELAVAARQARQEGKAASWYELLQRRGDELAAGLGAVAATLLRWKALLDRLPPHDALEAIYHEGDVLARFACAAPAALRDAVLANLRGLLGAALQVDGARYATPYRFVRALKAGGIPAPALADAQAVRLLTVHGAKGLEAPLVLMLDTDGAAARAESMGVVIEWPGEAPAPWRFAFIASESRPPACSVEALEVERTARLREELNALYVAMTRARQRLVVSSVQPYAAVDGSWWQRLQPHCMRLGAPETASATSHAAGQPELFSLAQLPPIAFTRPATPPPRPPGAADDSKTRFGQAVHRLLEGWAGDSRGVAAGQLRRVEREFSLTPQQAADAAAMAQRILTGEGAWAWDAGVVDWQANEVPLHHEGELLRLDRLVRRAGSREWWVLDYKAAASPEQQDELIEQMRRYRAAVQVACPGEPVRAAFLTGQGRLVVVA